MKNQKKTEEEHNKQKQPKQNKNKQEQKNQKQKQKHQGYANEGVAHPRRLCGARFCATNNWRTHTGAPEWRRCQACKPLMIKSKMKEMTNMTVATAVAPA